MPRSTFPAALLGAASLLAFSCAGAQIYDNGGLSSGTITDSGVAAPIGTEWSELQAAQQGGFAVANSATGHSANADLGYRLADDFTVPSGEWWVLQGVSLFVYQTGYAGTSSPVNVHTLRIWDGVPDGSGSTLLCGDTTNNRMTGSQATGLLRVFNTVVGDNPSDPSDSRRIFRNVLSVPPGCEGLPLPSGTYWLDWDALIEGSPSAHFVPTVLIPGARGRFGDNALQLESSVWQAVVDEGKSATGTVDPDDFPQDFPFLLHGLVMLPPEEVFMDGFED